LPLLLQHSAIALGTGIARPELRSERRWSNLLTVSPGTTLFGDAAELPKESVPMIRRIGPVESVAATGRIDAHVYRNDHVPVGETGSIAVLAADQNLPHTVGATVRAGSWLNPATAAYPGSP